MNEIVFIMPSVIYFSKNPLSYIETRSVYSPEERARQTKDGIVSIRRKVPNSKIILSEVGLKKDLPCDLEKIVDRYIYGGANSAVRRAVDSPNKGHGEAVALILADKATRAFGAQYYFKMSGRYRLDERFDLTRWLSHRDCFLAIKYNEKCIGTRLYGWPSELHEVWRSGIFRSIPDLRFGWAMEDTLPKFLPNIHPLNNIGLTGYIAPHACGVIE